MEIFSWTKSVYFRFYILCENFSKIGQIIKKIPNFVNDPLFVNSKWSNTKILNIIIVRFLQDNFTWKCTIDKAFQVPFHSKQRIFSEKNHPQKQKFSSSEKRDLKKKKKKKKTLSAWLFMLH